MHVALSYISSLCVKGIKSLATPPKMSTVISYRALVAVKNYFISINVKCLFDAKLSECVRVRVVTI